MSDGLWRISAVEAVTRLRNGEISPLELVEASARRIAEVDPAVNALPTLCLDRARDHAKRIMQGGAACEAAGEAGWLAGLPVSIKDLTDVAGVRTTYGSPLFANHVPAKSHPLVERIERKGGIVMGKSNTPEIRCRRQHLQRGLRQNAQSLEYGADLGRLDRRRRGIGRDRRGLAGAGQRPWRLAARPGQPLLRRWHTAIARPSDTGHREQSVEPALGAGANGSQCRRFGAVSRCNGGLLPAASRRHRPCRRARWCPRANARGAPRRPGNHRLAQASGPVRSAGHGHRSERGSWSSARRASTGYTPRALP
jgi:amidase